MCHAVQPFSFYCIFGLFDFLLTVFLSEARIFFGLVCGIMINLTPRFCVLIIGVIREVVVLFVVCKVSCALALAAIGFSLERAWASSLSIQRSVLALAFALIRTPMPLFADMDSRMMHYHPSI
jgi:hypothetical protein